MSPVCHLERCPPGAQGPGRPVPEGRQSHRGRELGQLEARVHADGVAQLLPEDAFLAVVGQLEQVEAGGGGGQTAARLPLADGEEASENAAQGVPRVLIIRHFDTADGEGRLEVGESQERGPGAAGHKLQHMAGSGDSVGLAPPQKRAPTISYALLPSPVTVSLTAVQPAAQVAEGAFGPRTGTHRPSLLRVLLSGAQTHKIHTSGHDWQTPCG